MKRFIMLGIVAALALGVSGSALAISNGQPDSAHPYVGLVFWPDPRNPGYGSLCSGALVAPTVVVTAAHCAEPALSDFAYVFFGQSPPYARVVTGTFHRDPGYCPGCAPGLPGFDTHDVAVVVLDAAVNDFGFAALPSAGLVDTLPMNTPVDLVGYGVQARLVGGGPPEWDWDSFPPTRYYAPTELVASNHVHADEFIKLRANPSRGSGGVCFGDSGGPDLLGGTNIILAVNSYVTNGNCAGVTYSNRVDTYALDFIRSFMP